MVKKYLTCSDLCTRWSINEFDLADTSLPGSCVRTMQKTFHAYRWLMADQS